METLFERIGGDAAVDAAVDKFYGKVLSDDRIKHFFEDVDMEKQSKHQKLFLTYAFGGIPSYPGKSMRKAHSHLVEKMGLNDEHFDAVSNSSAQPSPNSASPPTSSAKSPPSANQPATTS